MHDEIQHLILLAFSAALSAIGWFMAHNPARIYRAFTLGGAQVGENFFLNFLRVVGWCFASIFAGGVLLQATLVMNALTR